MYVYEKNNIYRALYNPSFQAFMLGCLGTYSLQKSEDYCNFP